MNIDISHLPNSLRSEPPARLAAYAMLFALGDVLDWTQPSAGLEIAGLERPAEPERRTLPLATLGALSDLDDWRDALRIAGGMNRREPPSDHGGINILVRPAAPGAHPWVLIDDLPPTRAVSLSKEYASIAVETTQGEKSQCWLLLDRSLHHPERTIIAQGLAKRLGGDSGAANGSQFGRLAGFRQRKVGKSGWTNILCDTSHTLQPWPSAALLSLPAGGISGCEASPPCPAVVDVPSVPSPSPDPAGPRAPTGGRPDGHECDESSREFAFSCHRLRAGWAPEQVERAVAEHAIARGKRRAGAPAEKYARATVRKALQAIGARP